VVGGNEAVQAALTRALGVPTDDLQVLVRVSPTGWSHRLPALRHFVYRGRELVACVKQIPRHRGPDATSVRACYKRFAARPSFTVPRLLGSSEDTEHLYFVEEAVRARSLTALVASGALTAEAAAAMLEAVLLDVWSLAGGVDDAQVRRSADALLAAADAIFGSQSTRALAASAIAELERAHRDELCTVLTTHDITTANLLRDDAGRVWLTDFDLAAETAFFGLDYVRSWQHSAPLRPPSTSPFTSRQSYHLYQALYPLLEYRLQAPHLAPPVREHLRRYAEDLFVRLTLPDYHARATFHPLAQPQHAPHAQLFFAEEIAAFSESESLRFAIDVDSGRLAVAPVITSERPLRFLRLDPTDTAQTVFILRRFTVAIAGGEPIDVLARLLAADTATGLDLVNLMPIAGSPAAFWSANADPQLVVDLAALYGTPVPPSSYRVDVELELVREWQRQPPYDPSRLLADVQPQLAALANALGGATQRAADALARARRGERRVRLVSAALPAQMPTGTAVPGSLPAAIARVRSLRDAQMLAAGIARGLYARALRAAATWRGSPAAAAAATPVTPTHTWLTYELAAARPWPSPLLSIVVLQEGRDAPPSEDTLLEWLSAQTCPSVEVVCWSRAIERAWEIRHPSAPWTAADWSDLRDTMAGRYLTVASADLVAQPPTYLEVNLIALETEALGFTVNVDGDPSPALAHLAAARAPGDTSAPLQRQIARAEYVTDDLHVDPQSCLAIRGGSAAAIGKVLARTTDDPPRPMPFDLPLPGPLSVVGTHLVAHRPGAPPVGTVVQPVSLADAVIDPVPLPDQRPTVIVVFPFLAVGGAERAALDVMRQLADRVRFVVVAVDPHDPSLGTTADLFRAITPYVYPAPDFLAPPLTFSLFAYLIRRFTPQTLYIANGCAWIYDALPTLKQHHPHLRTVNQVYDHRHGWIDRYDATLITALDAHIGCNEHICAAIRERGAPAASVHHVPHGIDTAEFDPARYTDAARQRLKRDFGLPDGRRVVSFLSRLHPQKRPMDFVELARQCASDPSLTFFMVGDGPLRGDVDEQIQRSRLTNLVRRRFHHPSRDLFAVSDVVVLPSAYEGMPLVVVEAQAMGKPALSTEVGNARELLAFTGGGVVSAIGDVGALRAGLRAVLETPPDAAAMRAAVTQRYGIATIAEQYYRVLLPDS
jgi:glycosyltransferase involved in cell wall biosynthesis